MSLRTVLLAGVAGVLALVVACSPPATQTTTTSGSTTTQSGGGSMADSIQPGKYRSTITILAMTIPGVPAQNLNMQPTTTEDCVTTTDVADFTRGSMVSGEEGENCTQNTMSSAGGHLEGTATCQSPTGPRTMYITGTYTSNHVEMDINTTGQMPNGGGEMSQHIRMVTDRIGECTAGDNAD